VYLDGLEIWYYKMALAFIEADERDRAVEAKEAMGETKPEVPVPLPEPK
jgi:hypothetical protein